MPFALIESEVQIQKSKIVLHKIELNDACLQT